MLFENKFLSFFRLENIQPVLTSHKSFQTENFPSGCSANADVRACRFRLLKSDSVAENPATWDKFPSASLSSVYDSSWYKTCVWTHPDYTQSCKFIMSDVTAFVLMSGQDVWRQTGESNFWGGTVAFVVCAWYTMRTATLAQSLSCQVSFPVLIELSVAVQKKSSSLLFPASYHWSRTLLRQVKKSGPFSHSATRWRHSLLWNLGQQSGLCEPCVTWVFFWSNQLLLMPLELVGLVGGA